MLNMSADQVRNPGPANYNPTIPEKKIYGRMKNRDQFIKDDQWNKQKEKDKFITPGPGVYNTRFWEHVGTVLINQKNTHSKIARDLSMVNP